MPEQLHESEERLRHLNATLEERVAERTAQLKRAHQARLEEIEQRQRAEEQLRHGRPCPGGAGERRGGRRLPPRDGLRHRPRHGRRDPRLSMVHGLAVQLGGALRLSSEPGRGTTAELWLPATTAAAPAARPEAVAVADEEAPRATILVVDDDALIAMSTGDMLLDLGHEVITAESGATALEILRDGRSVDLLITDYSMPKMTGAQLAKAVRELRPALPILLATGYAELPKGSSIDLPRLGKPYRQEQLAAEVGRMLRARPA